MPRRNWVSWLVAVLPIVFGLFGVVLALLPCQLQVGDLILVAPPDDAPIWYYSELHGIPDASFDTRNSAFERALVLVDPVEGQTPASVIAEHGPDPAALDVESARLLATFGKMQVFEIPRK